MFRESLLMQSHSCDFSEYCWVIRFMINISVISKKIKLQFLRDIGKIIYIELKDPTQNPIVHHK